MRSPLWALFAMAGLLGCMPAIPQYVTFIDSNPPWSWEGQWEGRGGMTVDFVQEGSHISSRNQVMLSVVSMDAEVTGNRAVGTISTSNPESPTLASPPDSHGAAATIHTVASAFNAVAQKLSGVPFPLSLVMSDDGMFLKGEVSDPITHEITFRRIGSPAALTTEQRPSEVSVDEPDDDEEAVSQSRTAGPGAVPHAPMGASQSSPPAGYYQCYRLTVAISANTSKLGDLQLDGQANYSSTAGPGGTYVFDPAVGVVSFNGGMLNGRMARAKLSNKGTYMMRMRPEGNGLPSPKQTFGTYTFEHKSSGRRARW
ncbi:MAG: hypothetical protein ACREYF_00705 [Gammaproteobacteria bacterium]